MTPRIVAFIAVLSLLLPLTARFAAAAEPVAMENEFVRVVVNAGPDEAGRFSIKTTGGDPSRPTSKNKHLIFGANAPWTSYTTVQVDGANYVFGGTTQRRAGHDAKYGKETVAPALTDNTITSTYQLGDIAATQSLAFARGISTRVMDTIAIRYKLTNTGNTTRKVGLRVMLDTMCGSNDGAPIRSSGSSDAITKALLLAGKDVPEYWLAFDSLANATVISRGSLRGGELSDPDKVIFADWGTLADDPWQPAIGNDQGFIRKGETDPDTATAMLWEPAAVEPGQSISFVTYYGIGGVQIAPGNLTVGLEAPAQTTFEHERTEDFTITGFVQNAGGFEGRNIATTLTLPAGLTLLQGNLKHSYDALKPDDIVQESWKVRANGKQAGQQKIALSVSSTNLEANKGTRDIMLDVPPSTVTLVPGTQAVPLVANGLPRIVLVDINLKPAENFYGIRFTVKYDPNVVVPLGAPFGLSRGSAFVDGGRLLDWNFDDSADGVITVSGKRQEAPVLTQAEINLALIKFRTVGAGKTALTIENAVAIDKDGAEHPLAVADGEIIVNAPAQ